MSDEHLPYEPPAVTDLGTLTQITAGAGGGARDVGANDSHGKT